MNIPAQFKIQTAPVADPHAVVTAGKARFSVLTDRLVRIEYSPSGEFEDHASQAFWFRHQPVPAFKVTQTDQGVEIETDFIHLRYQNNPKGFTPKTLTVDVKSTDTTWHYKDHWHRSGQLHGTARTLDGVSGHTELEVGPMARSGWAVLDDSKSVVFNEEHWAQQRVHTENLDFYFFGYGHDYVTCLRDYCKVTGPIPMIPRYILGNWWSRYWAYTQAELTGLMEDFEQNNVPLSVCIVDMDWHLAGWTGYTWNRELWPEPEQFIAWLHSKGLRTALNLHPSDGVGTHESQYEQMAAMLGQDPKEGEAVAFDIASPRFAQAYFDLLHHPYEKMGVDFWWMDWQQERVTNMPGLDPLWWLNHLHYMDLARDGKKRPFVFSRWGGLGNHRYPIGFSGDTEITWESLAFQPYFTSTAANVAYSWWSHDIGGHMGGIEDDELYIRWVQFGVFSPIMRLHCTNNPYHERRPWGRGPAADRATSTAMRLRHRLIPYIYSMAWLSHKETLPLVTPMYYWAPEEELAYHARDQYWFGSQLVVAPFIQSADKEVGLSRQRVWLPEGEWFNFFNGERQAGGKVRIVYGGLDDIPVFAKAGAIVPLGQEVGWGGVDNPKALDVIVFPGADNHFDLYEDDGETVDYQTKGGAVTRFSTVWKGSELVFQVAQVEGDGALIPAERSYHIQVRGVSKPGKVSLAVNGVMRDVEMVYDAKTLTCSVRVDPMTPGDALELSLVAGEKTLLSDVDARPQAVRRLLTAMRINSWLKQVLDKDMGMLLSGERSPRVYPYLNDAQVGALENILA